MSTILDGPLRAVARKVLDTFGATCTVTVMTYGSYDTATGGATDTATGVAVKAVVYPVSNRDLFGGVKLGDQKLVMPATYFTAAPSTQDRVTIGSQSCEIVRVDPIRSGAQVAVYEVYVRGPASTVT